MKIYEKLENKKKEGKIKYKTIYSNLGITKQAFYYHMKNLKKGKISFNPMQLKKISDISNIKIDEFF